MMQDIVTKVSRPNGDSDDLLEDVFADLDIAPVNVDPPAAPVLTPAQSAQKQVVAPDAASGNVRVVEPAAMNPATAAATIPATTAASVTAQPVTFFEQEEQAHIDDYYASSTTWTDNAETEDQKNGNDVDDDDEKESPLNQAIPVEKLKNGARTAMELWSWGVGKVKEAAAEVAENEKVKQVRAKVGEAYDSNLRPGVERVREAAAPVVHTITEGASSAYEASKPKLEEFKERAAPVVDELGHKASEGWEVTKTKAVELGEACRPGIDKAAASTCGIFNETSKRFSSHSSTKKPNEDVYEPFSTGAPIVSESNDPSLKDI